MTAIASAGVIVASAALFIVLSVFSGLKDFSLQFTSVIDPDLKLLPVEGKSFLWTDENDFNLSEITGVEMTSKVIEERIFIKCENKNIVATLKGVDANYLNVTRIDSMVTKGQWLSANSNDVVSGLGISQNLSFGVFNYLKPLSLFVPKPGKGQSVSLKSVYNSVIASNVGLFDVNEQLNNTYVYANITLARELLTYKNNQVSALELKLADGADEALVKQAIASKFPNQFTVKNRAQLNAALYKMLNTENLAIYLIFTLVIIIALFNIIGAIIMMILDKRNSLNTLFNLGVEAKAIKTIFFLQGTLMVIISGCVGVVIGVLAVCYQLYGPEGFKIYLTPELPYPVALNLRNLALVLLTIFILGVVASKIASQRINKRLIRT